MISLVLISNLVIALINLYIAWRLWRLQKVLIKVTITLNQVESVAYAVLSLAPETIAQREKGIENFRESYDKLKHQFQKIRKILTILSLTYTIWQRLRK